MRYELISPESARALEGFLPQYVLDNPDFNKLFFYAATGDDGGAVGVAAVDPLALEPELLSIGISSSFEGKGYGSALLSFICTDLFEKQGEECLIRASMNLPLSDWGKLEYFFTKNNFVLNEDSPVYNVKLSEAMDSEILKNAASRASLKGLLQLKDVPDNKLRVFSHSIVNKGLFNSIGRNGLDEDVSIFYMPGDEIAACALFAKSGDVLQNTWVYVDPELSGGMTFASLLSEAAGYASKKYPPDTVVSFIAVEDNSRELIKKVLPDIEPATEIRTYTKLLTGLDDTSLEGRDDPQFEEVSEGNMCCADCANSMGEIFECRIYSRKPDAVVDGESCLYFEDK